MKKQTVAIEFDGTIVEDNYPGIGKEKPQASRVIKALQSRGHTILLYTFRKGEELRAAVNWCAENGIFFDGINQNPGNNKPLPGSRKVDADVYIDGKNLGGMPTWKTVFHFFYPHEVLEY